MAGKDKNQAKRLAPFSLRLSFQERAKLEELAAGESLSSFIKRHIFAGDKSKLKNTKRGKAPVKDHILLGQVLAALGHSRLSQNMNQLAKAVYTGNLPLQYDIERDLKQACDDIHVMRLLLMKALGMQTKDIPERQESTRQTFTRAATDHPELRP